jgi:hypothetical protein
MGYYNEKIRRSFEDIIRICHDFSGYIGEIYLGYILGYQSDV